MNYLDGKKLTFEEIMTGEIKYKPTNREKKLKTTTGKRWCLFCDSCLLHIGDKCPNCGKRDFTKKLKKYYIE